jgi:hypothetical protein
MALTGKQRRKAAVPTLLFAPARQQRSPQNPGYAEQRNRTTDIEAHSRLASRQLVGRFAR